METPSHASRAPTEAGTRTLYVEIVERAAEVSGTDPLEMPPMSSAVDLEALDRLFDRDPTSYPELRGSLAFRYAGCEVEIHADGHVEVTPDFDTQDRDAR